MIVDSIDRMARYFSLHPRFEKAFSLIKKGGFTLGRQEIEEGHLALIYEEIRCKPRNQAKLEVHRKYIDIQCVIDGEEEMGWKPLEMCQTVLQPYNVERDILFFKDEPLEWLRIPTGYFAIFFPEDAHAPMIGTGTSKKVIMKVGLH